jgi:ATP synthase protein I
VNRDKHALRLVAMVGSMGTEVIILAVGGAWLGKLADNTWHTKPLWLLCGLFVGLLIGFVSAAYTLKAFLKE